MLGKSISVIGLTLMTSLAWAADMPKIDCTLTDNVTDNQPVIEKTIFPLDLPYVHLVCQSDEVSKGQNIKAIWIAADTKGAAPDNYKIDEKSLLIEEDLGDNKIWTADYKLSKPEAGWPVGSYHVDLYVDKELYKSYNFTFK